MKGEVKVLLAFQPDRVFFRNAAKGTSQSEVVVLSGELAEKAKLSEPTSSKPEFKAELTKKDDQKAVKITFTAPEQEGRHSAQVTVKTGLDKPAELTLHAMAQVTGDLVPDRNYAIFAPFNKDNPPKFSLKVRSLTSKPFKIEKVVDPSGAVTGVASKKDGAWDVELTLTKATGTPRGKVELHTDRADQRQLVVNYSVRGNHQRLPAGVRKLGGPGAKVKPTLIPTGASAKGSPIRLQLKPGIHKVQRPIRPVPSTAQPPARTKLPKP